MASTPYGVKTILTSIQTDAGPAVCPNAIIQFATIAVAHFSRQRRQRELAVAGSKSTTICQPCQGGTEVASEELVDRFDLEFKLFAHSRETALRPIDA